MSAVYEYLSDGGLVSVDAPQELTLSGYQKRAARFAIAQQRGMLALDPGLGKTVCVLAAFRTLQRHGMAHRMLVVAPLRPAQIVWRQEIAKWAPFAHLSSRLLHGRKKAEAAAAGADIDVVNYEGLKWLVGHHGICPYDVIVFDESTLLKNPQSKRGKLIRPWAFAAPYVWELTGTPTPRSYEDLWAQMFLLDGGQALGRYITHFRDRYFYPKRKRGHVVYEYGLKDGAGELIEQAVAPLILRMSAEDYLDLPDFIFRNIEVQLPAKAMKQYRSMERDMFAELDDGESVAMSASSAYGRCRQIIGGGLYKDERERDEYHLIHNAKTDALKELLESLQGEPVLIAIQFRHEIERVAQATEAVTGEEPPVVASGSKVDIEALEQQWNRGEIPAVIVNPASLSHGANLQDAGIGVVWYSMTDNLEHYDQLNRRLRRRGRAKPVFVWHLIAQQTLDLAVADRNDEKSGRQQSLLDALHSYRHTV